MSLAREVGLDPSDIVLDGDPAPRVCCGQTAGWIKMPLGTKVGLSPGHIVLLELDASVNASHPSDDIGEESYSLCISPFVSKMAIFFCLKPANGHPKIISSSRIFHSLATLLLKENLATSSLILFYSTLMNDHEGWTVTYQKTLLDQYFHIL